MALVADIEAGRPLALDQEFSAAMGKVLADPALDRAFMAEMLSLPTEAILGQYSSPVAVDAIHQARDFVSQTLAAHHRGRFEDIYYACQTDQPYVFSQQAVADRRLKNLSLSYLMKLDDGAAFDLCRDQLRTADNMTDEIVALSLMANSSCDARQQALGNFYDKWHHDALVLDKWFSVQGGGQPARNAKPGPGADPASGF